MTRLLLPIAAVLFAGAALPGSPASAQQSIAQAREACTAEETDPQACTIWALDIIESSQVSDREQGGKMLAVTCQAGWADACYQHGLIAGRGVEGVGAADWEERYSFRLACDLEHAQGCYALARLYANGDGVDREPSTALALSTKACDLGARKACNFASQLAPGGREDPLWRDVASINPARTAADQIARAQAIIDGSTPGNRSDAFWTIVRLMEEKNSEAEWIVAEWLAEDGFSPFLPANEGNAVILYDNAARKGHIEALIEMGMRYWEGKGVNQDQRLGMSYMATAGSRGSEMAIGIWRSMYAEPQRQRMRREYEAAQRRQEEWWANAANRSAQASYNSWQPSTYGYNSGQDRRAADARYAARVDRQNFNNAMNYITGSSSVCPSFNPYC